MRTYQFQALNSDGQKVRGTIPANSHEQALQSLKLKRLQPITLQAQRFSWLYKNSSNTWTIEWAKDMGFFLKQGLSLLESLQTSKLRLNQRQKQLIDILLEGLYAGATLSQILAEHPLFPKIFIGLLSVSEVTGQYAQAFEDYALLRQEEADFFKQLRTSLQYPLVLTIIILGMVIGFSEFLFPVALEFFRNNNFEQHLATTLFIHFAEALKNIFNMFTNVPLVLAIFATLYLASKITKLKTAYSWLSLKWPIFGSIYLETLQSFYLKSFSTLLQRGHHVVQAAHYSADILQNAHLKDQAHKIERSIRNEGNVSLSLSKFLNLPKPLADLLLIGERASQIAIYSDICAQTLKNHCQHKLKKILAWTGPILVSIMGIVMIWMVVAIVVPLYDQIARMD
jgi:type IV pilus assembly protein PilC